jgi:thiamine-phosphate pyrophosphorylase
LAVREGADHAGVGPIFPSDTKHFDSFPGLELVRAAKAMQDIPWFALGGVSPGNLDQVLEAGARRVAVSRCVLASGDPGGICRALKNRLESFSP